MWGESIQRGGGEKGGKGEWKKSRRFISEDVDVMPDKLWLELVLFSLLVMDAQQEAVAPGLVLIPLTRRGGIEAQFLCKV